MAGQDGRQRRSLRELHEGCDAVDFERHPRADAGPLKVPVDVRARHEGRGQQREPLLGQPLLVGVGSGPGTVCSDRHVQVLIVQAPKVAKRRG